MPRRNHSALGLMVAATLACSPVPQTEIVVVVSSDLPRGAVLRSVRVVAQRSGVAAAMHDVTYRLTDTRYPLPGEVTLVARDPDDARPVTVRVIGELDGRTLAQEAVARFQRERTLYLQMTLASQCVDRDCGAGSTCRLGECVPVGQIPVSESRPTTLQAGDGALPTDAAGDVVTSDVSDVVSGDDVIDGGVANDAPDVVSGDDVVDAAAPADVVDVVKAADVPDVPPAMDVADVPSAMDVVDVPSAMDVADVPPTMDVADVPPATDVVDVPRVDLGPPETCPNGRIVCAAACVDTQSDPAHCGACGRLCAPPNATGECAFGSCLLGSCDTGFADCNALAAGCETDARSDPAHCGRCNNPCPAVIDGEPACVAGVCGARCEPNWVVQGGRCVPDFPRPLAPLSGARLSGTRVQLRWTAVSGATEYLVRVCSDRACSSPIVAQAVTDTSFTFDPTVYAQTFGRYFWSVAARRGGALGTLSPVWQFAVSWWRINPARVIASYPDYNGDGYGDAALPQIFPGAIRVFGGGASGLPTREDLYLALASCNSPRRATHLGDVNGDGYSDVQWDCDGASYRAHGGATALTAVGGTTHRPVLAGIGDFDGDGYGDVLDAAGEVIYGSSRGLDDARRTRLAVPTTPTLSGDSTPVSAAGWADIDNDGRSEVVVGRTLRADCGAACGDCGRVMVYRGVAGRPATHAPSEQISRAVPDGGLSVCSNLGASLAWLDSNGDSFPDLAVGAPGWSGSPSRPAFGRAGAVFLAFGTGTALGTLDTLWDPLGNNQQCGASLVSPGTIRGGDGMEELVVTCANPLRHELFAGALGGNPQHVGAFGGEVVSFQPVGYLDGDGLPDLVAAYCESGGPSGLRLWRGAMTFSPDASASQRVQLGVGCLPFEFR